MLAPSGLSLEDALIYYNRNSSLQLTSIGTVVTEYQGLLDLQRIQVLSTRNRLVMALHERFLALPLLIALRKSLLVGKGYTALGQITRTVIPADWWSQVNLCVRENWAEANRVRILDVLIWPNVTAAVTDVPIPEESVRALPVPLKVSEFEAWYRDTRVAPWRPGLPIPSLEADRKAARQRFGQECRADLNRVRREYAPPEWRVGKAGRKPAAD